MEHTRSERGFKQMEPITCDYGTGIRVHESSAAEAPHIWLALNEDSTVLTKPTPGQAHAHLSLEAAEQLRDQLDWLIEHHYQVEVTT